MPNRLSRLFSSSDKEKEALAEASANQSSPTSSSPPPAYTQSAVECDQDNVLVPPDVTAGFSKLSFSENKPHDDTPTTDECIAHLKLLECFYRLRQTIGASDGVFGIKDELVTSLGLTDNEEVSKLLASLAEKRWSIYVHRAVQRFESWWERMMPDSSMATIARLEKDGPTGLLCDRSYLPTDPLTLSASNMPPVDVLMVWHAFMLNPRAYLEDCLRFGRMQSWHTCMPWKTVSECVNSDTFVFEPQATAKWSFETLTSLPWDNLNGSDHQSVLCPSCERESLVAWTTCSALKLPVDTSSSSLSTTLQTLLSLGEGFCDQAFSATCEHCRASITHESLAAGKFLADVRELQLAQVPLRGTLLGEHGIPWSAFGTKELLMADFNTLPNRLLSSGFGETLIANQQTLLKDGNGMANVRREMDRALQDHAYMRKVRSSPAHRMLRTERIAVRKMMSRYWNNSSPFALDLVGAVIRQGSFIEKMHCIDWLHSPALPNTMKRLITKYGRFLSIMAKNPLKMAVPTLDVDLAWHTHQLSPPGYMMATIRLTKQFVDHDDKVAETKLNDAFAWTSKTYQKLYGEPYSACTCWYCEAVRESHTSAASRLFNSSSAHRAEQALHSADGSSGSGDHNGSGQDPRKSVHISAHNAVRPTDAPASYGALASRKAAELSRAYDKACARARAKKRPPPRRDDYYYSDAWGYPVFIPAYSPYLGFVPYSTVCYPVNPGCMALGTGAVGNCCAGTCGGGVAAGGCGGGGVGGCAGGAAGGCAGGAAGGCGGGGGGGGGCGGGGGGGGCGGGGGGCGGGGS